jgi:competence protein ComEC
MLRYCLCMLAGAYSFLLPGYFPSTAYLSSIAGVATVCMLKAPLRVLAFFLLGLSLHWLAALQMHSDILPVALEGQTLQVTVFIDDFPLRRGNTLRFVGTTDTESVLPNKIRLSWYEAPEYLDIGDTWSLQVRLRRPRGFANPHGFDYEGWLFRQRIGATGYVVAAQQNLRLSDVSASRTTRFRRYFVQRVSTLLPDDDATAVLLAISVGARQLISRQQWDRYAVTGTSHLMAISGLHIGLAAAGVFVIVWGAAGLFCRTANLRDSAMVCAVCAAVAYAQLSGFAVPARRAMLMVTLAIGALLLRRRVAPAHILALVCVLVVVSDPLAILAPGFQLSFAAVALLLWHSRSTEEHIFETGIRVLDACLRGVQRLVALQLMLLMGLFPLVSGIFGRVAWMAVPVNLAVLPIFNFVTVPTALLGMLLDGPLRLPGDALLNLSHASIQWVLNIVTLVADSPGARLQLPYSGTAMVAAAILVAAWALLPRLWPGRHVAWISLVAVLVHRPNPPPSGCFDVHVLDVGQGLAVVVQTMKHLLVYDVGPAFRSGGDTGQLVVAPFLQQLGIKRVDTLVVSHSDLDHAGGSKSLQQLVDVQRVLTGEEAAHTDSSAQLCVAGQNWRWDAVDFSIIHPESGGRGDGNDASCVLSISAGSRRALLTGDIESRVEKSLVKLGRVENADFVTVPHHGSRTSSTGAFLDAVSARIAVVSNGYGNRWGLPKGEVVDRWRRTGAKLLSTAESGAISQRICARGAQFAPREERRTNTKYWRQ